MVCINNVVVYSTHHSDRTMKTDLTNDRWEKQYAEHSHQQAWKNRRRYEAVTTAIVNDYRGDAFVYHHALCYPSRSLRYCTKTSEYSTAVLIAMHRDTLCSISKNNRTHLSVPRTDVCSEIVVHFITVETDR